MQPGVLCFEHKSGGQVVRTPTQHNRGPATIATTTAITTTTTTATIITDYQHCFGYSCWKRFQRVADAAVSCVVAVDRHVEQAAICWCWQRKGRWGWGRHTGWNGKVAALCKRGRVQCICDSLHLISPAVWLQFVRKVKRELPQLAVKARKAVVGIAWTACIPACFPNGRNGEEEGDGELVHSST